MNGGKDAGRPPPAPRDPGDRRRVVRREVWEYAIATPVSAGQPPFEVRITDASDEGIGFRSPQALAVGTDITLNLLSLNLTGSFVRCRVVRCTPVDAGFAIGAMVVR